MAYNGPNPRGYGEQANRTRSPLSELHKGQGVTENYFNEVAAQLRAGVEISDPAIWQLMGKVVGERFHELTAHQSPFSTIKMLQVCADQQIKSKILAMRGGASKSALDDFRQLSQAITGVTGEE